MQKFRQGRRRIDFHPTDQVNHWLERLATEYPRFSANHLLNDLLRHGVERLFPEESKQTWLG
jgi:hypothetical protein